MSEDLLALFRKTAALLDGHFVLRSGLHSRQYFQCAILLQHTDIAAEVCGQLADKLDDGKLVLRRGFQISPDEKFIVVEDVVTRGGRVQETIDIVRAHSGVVSAVGVIVDRSGDTKPAFGCPFVNLVELSVENFPADNLPPDLARTPVVKPGSK